MLHLRFRPPASHIAKARRLLDARNYESALTAARLSLDKLRDAATHGSEPDSRALRAEASMLEGVALLRLDRRSDAVAPLIAGAACLDDQPEALEFLATELLGQRTLTQEVFDLILQYVRHPSSADDAPACAANLTRLRRRLQPVRRDGRHGPLTKWNEAISAARPHLAWPKVHLGLIRASAGAFTDAADLFEQACAVDPLDLKAIALLHYSRSRLCKGDAASSVPHRCADDDWRTLLVWAHTYRASGDASASAAAFRAADATKPLDPENLHVYAEALLNSGNPRAARDVLRRLSGRDSPRRTLLAAAASQSPHAAIKLLERLRADETYGLQATRRLVAMVAHGRFVAGADTMLESVPPAHRDDIYWLACSNVALRAGDGSRAVSALASVREPVESLDEHATRLAHWHCASLFNAGRYMTLLRFIASATPRSVLSPAVEELASCALTHLARTASLNRFHAVGAAELVARIGSALPAILQRPDVQAACAVLASTSGTRGTAATRNQPPGLTGRLRSNREPTTADTADRRERRIAAGEAALAGDVHRALELLDRPDAEPGDAPFIAALCFRGGLFDRIERRAESDGAFAYYAAVTSAMSGDLASAARWLTLSPCGKDHTLAAASTAFDAWMSLRNALDRLRQGDAAAFTNGVADALSRWRDEASPAHRLPHLYARLTSAFADANRRSELQIGLEQLGDRDADAGHCHRLAIYQLSEAGRCADQKSWKEAVDCFESASAHLCVALADEEYLHDWVGRRLATYGVSAGDGHSLVTSTVTEALQRVLRGWEPRLRDSGEDHLLSRLEDADIALRAELRGAQLLRALGGFAPDAELSKTIVAGPEFVGRTGRGPRLAVFLNDSKKNDSIGLLRLLYSRLRHAVVLEEDGRLIEALERVRRRPEGCSANCAGGSRLRCDERSEQFARCNPAFAYEGGGAALDRTTADFEESLLLKAGELAIASTDDRVDEGLQFWRSALDVAVNDRTETSRRIRTTTLGRGRVLRDSDRLEEGVRLLEAVNELCGDEEIEGLLADLHARLGVNIGNKTGDWQAAVSRLRRARELNSRSTYIDRNLVVCLANRAREMDEAGMSELLQEAVDIARINIFRDPLNAEWRELSAMVRSDLLVEHFSHAEVSATTT